MPKHRPDKPYTFAQIEQVLNDESIDRLQSMLTNLELETGVFVRRCLTAEQLKPLSLLPGGPHRYTWTDRLLNMVPAVFGALAATPGMPTLINTSITATNTVLAYFGIATTIALLPVVWWIPAVFLTTTFIGAGVNAFIQYGLVTDEQEDKEIREKLLMLKMRVLQALDVKLQALGKHEPTESTSMEEERKIKGKEKEEQPLIAAAAGNEDLRDILHHIVTNPFRRLEQSPPPPSLRKKLASGFKKWYPRVLGSLGVALGVGSIAVMFITFGPGWLVLVSVGLFIGALVANLCASHVAEKRAKDRKVAIDSLKIAIGMAENGIKERLKQPSVALAAKVESLSPESYQAAEEEVRKIEEMQEKLESSLLPPSTPPIAAGSTAEIMAKLAAEDRHRVSEHPLLEARPPSELPMHVGVGVPKSTPLKEREEPDLQHAAPIDSHQTLAKDTEVVQPASPPESSNSRQAPDKEADTPPSPPTQSP